MWTWVSIVLQTGLLACAFYYVLLFFRGTKGAQVLLGLAVALIFLIGSTQLLQWTELNWLLRSLSVYLAVGVLVIFQPEIRRALAELGRQRFSTPTGETKAAIEQVVRAVGLLADQRIGALIAIERDISTGAVQQTGRRLDARLAAELLASIFYPHTPLHDGGVIIRGNRIVAAGCVFPLSQNLDLYKHLGTRHLAALGMSEETDAAVIVVSEETGTISVCYRGRLSRGLDAERLREFLSVVLMNRSKLWPHVVEQLTFAPEEGSDDTEST